jgi:hypothetical protein
MRERARRNFVDTRQEVFIVHEEPQFLFTLAYLGHIGGYDGGGEEKRGRIPPAMGSTGGRSNEGGMVVVWARLWRVVVLWASRIFRPP